MNRLVLILSFICMSFYAHSQSADDFYNLGANQFIDGNTPLAVRTIDEGIKRYPNDEDLPWLRERILRDQNEQNQDDKKQDDQEKSEEEKSEESKDGEKQDQENQEEQQDQEGEKSDEEKKKEMDEATKQKLKEMNISEEKAQMILEALKNNEIQYIQQRKRQPTEQQDSGKPDW